MTQKQALTILKTGGSVFLTGEPGSGKTHTVNEYIEYLKDAGITVSVTASTGIAATHIHGMTVHSWSGIGIKKTLTDFDVDRIATNERLVKRIKRTQVLIIDEISMLDSKTLTSIDRVCRAIKGNTQAFGGLQVVLVGDFFQLPPISRREEDKAQFAFTSEAWKAANFMVCYLSEQHRQEDPTFLEILSALRRNRITASHKQQLDARALKVLASQEETITKLFSHNEDVDRMNEEQLKRIEGPSKVFSMASSGKDHLVEQLMRGCLSPEKLALKKGAVVMFTKNSPKGLFVNGTLGQVIDFDAYSRCPVVKTKAGRELVVEPMDWGVEDNGRVLARISQIPLRLAWAMTVHKSQGMSLDAAFIDLRDAFVEGQGYVALSRVRTLAGLYLAGYNEAALQVHEEVLQQDELFREQSAAATKEFSALPAAQLKTLHQNFIKALGGNGAKSKRKNRSRWGTYGRFKQTRKIKTKVVSDKIMIDNQ